MHGIPLPETGTFESRLFAEGVYRTRMEQLAFTNLFARLISLIGGVKSEVVDSLLKDYAAELFQRRYTSNYESERTRMLREMVNARAEDHRLLQKVARLSADGDPATMRSSFVHAG